MVHWLKQKLLNKYSFCIGLLTLCIGLYFTVITNPWVTFCPGTQSSDMDTVDPQLAKKIDRILSTLQKEGFHATISSTHRSPEKQQCYYDISQVIQKYTGQNGLTTTTRSCHNNMKNGKPASLAVDIHYFSGSIDDKAKFYIRLRELVRSEGLTSGGDFKKKNPVWAKYDLGWDPGHIQTRNCKKRIKLK